MARHDINSKRTFIDRTKELFVRRVEPIIIPRNKLDAAYERVSKVEKQNKKLKIIGIVLIIQTIILVGVLYGRY